MDTNKYVLLSLQEKPYEEIKAGKKFFEYRTRYQKCPTIAFIYVSHKVKCIKAMIEFDEPIIGTDIQISSLSEKIKPGSYDGMMKYLSKGTGYAIPIRRFIEIEPVSLAELREKFGSFVVPQSYYMLNQKEELLKFLLEKKHLSERKFEQYREHLTTRDK